MSGKAIKIKIAGRIDEQSSFPQLSSTPKSITLDLGGVTMINSTGVKRWVEWIKGLPQVPLYAENAPPVIVDQCNMVFDFIPKRMKFISFFVPYYCEDTDDSKYVLYKAGEDYFYNEDKVDIKIKEIKSGPNSEPYELDVIKDKYFGFLNS